MKRLLIVVLLLIVPLQTGLAAVCGYCTHAAEGDAHALAHGAAKAKQPAGHAADGHAAGDQPADDSAAGQGGDGECPLCHLGCGSAITAQLSLPAVDLPAAAPPHRSAPYQPSHLDRIDHVPLPAAGLS